MISDNHNNDKFIEATARELCAMRNIFPESPITKKFDNDKWEDVPAWKIAADEVKTTLEVLKAIKTTTDTFNTFK
jgi:hypothetical protein